VDRLLRKLEEKGLMDRTTLIVFSDHGEAFGEHGLHHHASSLYDELLRVPLLFVLPKGQAQKVDEPVSLMDVAPTILDLMGAETPGVYMGQSLVPFLRGERPKLLRPIVAEGRLKRAIVLRDGFKVIHDSRAGYVEVYDLNEDPGEESNLYRDGDKKIVRRYGVLHAYFEANTFKKKGYKVPYRKW
jgi:arylsulfatase A-like enzyme